MKVGILSFGFPNFRYDIGEENLKYSIKKLVSEEYELIYKESILIDEIKINEALKEFKKENVDLLIIQCGTYTFGSAMVKVIEMFKEVPLIIWGFREPYLDGFRGLPLNSLCGINMFGSFLKKAKKEYNYVYGGFDEEAVYEKVKGIIKAVNIKLKLKETKFCIIGGRVPGFYLSNVDELKFRHKLGIEIVYYSIASLLNDVNKIDENRVVEEVDKMKKEVAVVASSDEMLKKSARIYLAINDFKEKNSIDGFTIKCWPEFQELYNCSVCAVVSRLNNEGTMTSCEGDVTGLATMYIQYLISNEKCFFADLVNVNEMGIAKVWHCGPAPICLAANQCETKIIEHPTIKNGVGVAMDFKLKLGRLVMLKIKETEDGYILFMAKGTGVEVDRDLSANQADIKFDNLSEKVVEAIMENGIEHHFAIVYKDIEKELEEVCRCLEIKIIKS